MCEFNVSEFNSSLYRETGEKDSLPTLLLHGFVFLNESEMACLNLLLPQSAQTHCDFHMFM